MDRTCDKLLTRQLLYQLSYEGGLAGNAGLEPATYKTGSPTWNRTKNSWLTAKGMTFMLQGNSLKHADDEPDEIDSNKN